MSLGSTLFLCFVVAVIGAGIRSIIRQQSRHPEQHEHVPGEWL